VVLFEDEGATLEPELPVEHARDIWLKISPTSRSSRRNRDHLNPYLSEMGVTYDLATRSGLHISNRE
jgi:hypothetical protein